MNQLTSAVSTETPPVVNQSWNYDPMGNRTQTVNTPGSNPTSTATYTNNSTTQYAYDDADRLSSVIYQTDQGVNVSKGTYAYDGLSRLRIIAKYSWDTGTSAWSYFRNWQHSFLWDA